VALALDSLRARRSSTATVLSSRQKKIKMASFKRQSPLFYAKMASFRNCSTGSKKFNLKMATF